MNVINSGISQDLVDRDQRDIALRIPIGLLNDLSAARTRSETLQCFASWSHLIVEADRCSVALFEDDRMVILGLSGDRVIPTGARLSLTGTLVGKVHSERVSQQLNNLSTQPYPDTRKVAESGMRAVLAAPILAGNRCFGALCFAFAMDVSDDLDRMAIIEALAGCLATQLFIVEQIHELARLAETDPLTQTFNRRHFYEVSQLLWEHWEESRVPFAVAAIDIDHFKSVNDEHGHCAGDEVLKVIATRLQKCLREGDIAVRMGGEEFLLLLRNCTQEPATKIAERATSTVRDNPIHIGEADLSVTISIGVAGVSDADQDVEALCKRADNALYRAKNEGRDRVRVDDGSQGTMRII